VTVAAAHVNWSRSEVAAALEVVRAAAPKLSGRKQALEQLERAERKLETKPNAEAHIALHFGERPLGLLGTKRASRRESSINGSIPTARC
jgi:hypothetical protein